VKCAKTSQSEFFIDLKEGVTIEEVEKLIALGDDSTHSQIRVTRDGLAYLSKKVGSRGADQVLFRLRTFAAGNDYVGPDAAKDALWIKRIYRALKKNWPTPYNSFIDIF